MAILITGASSGIGAALAVEAARRGAETLFLAGRDEARLSGVKSQALAAGAKRVETRAVDVSDEAAMRSYINECDASSPLDTVFANAGIATGSETEGNVRRTFAVNVGGVVNTALPAIEAFRRHGGGQLVLTSSIAGYHGMSTCPSYSASKAAVKAWGAGLRGLLKGENIKVNVICPGFVRSRITDKNTCPMPFFMEADRAARIILSRVKRNVPLISFPWPMRFATWLLSILPERLSALILTRLPEKVSTRD